MSRWAYPEEDDDFLAGRILASDSILSFQRDLMIPLAHVILQRTSQGMTWSGLENIDHSPTLFISNHRDIVLDAYLLQVILLENGFETSQIIAGANLYVNGFVEDVATCNKIIAIGRGGSKRGFGEQMMHISSVLRGSLAPHDGQGSSVWIAQRNGRTKNRIDKTDPSIIHMLSMTGSIADYRIVPVTITYEIEPNAQYKARHLWHLENPETTADEDYMEQMLGSILQPKGHIHYTFHKPLDLAADSMSPKEYYQTVAQRIDDAILGGYRKWVAEPAVESQWQQLCADAPHKLLPYMQVFAPQYL